MKKSLRYYIGLFTIIILSVNCSENHKSYDIVVYGGTSAGVIAAVKAARLGHSVILIESGNHLGGLTSGGLGATDIGNKKAIGGMAREFYERIHDHYHPESDSLGSMWVFEPSVAEKNI